jgi:adenosine deaminase
MPDQPLPLIDLHRHLEGTLRLETCIDLARQHGVELPATVLEELRPHVQILEAGPDLPAFLARVELMARVLADYEACRRIAYESVEDAAREGLHYVELRFSPAFMANPHNLHREGVVEAVIDGVEAGSRTFGVKTKLIGILTRTFGPVSTTVELEALLVHRDHIVALDLAGDEEKWPGNEFVSHFRRRDAEWQVTVHAGEAAGPESIWQAIRELGAQRIGHGVRAAEDPALMQHMAEQGIGVESCLTSNVQTSTVASYQSHPLRRFLEEGLLATINTDDPSVSGIGLKHELTVAARAAGLSDEQIEQARKNAITISFLSPDERRALLDAMKD